MLIKSILYTSLCSALIIFRIRPSINESNSIERRRDYVREKPSAERTEARRVMQFLENQQNFGEIALYFKNKNFLDKTKELMVSLAKRSSNIVSFYTAIKRGEVEISLDRIATMISKSTSLEAFFEDFRRETGTRFLNYNLRSMLAQYAVYINKLAEEEPDIKEGIRILREDNMQLLTDIKCLLLNEMQAKGRLHEFPLAIENGTIRKLKEEENLELTAVTLSEYLKTRRAAVDVSIYDTILRHMETFYLAALGSFICCIKEILKDIQNGNDVYQNPAFNTYFNEFVENVISLYIYPNLTAKKVHE